MSDPVRTELTHCKPEGQSTLVPVHHGPDQSQEGEGGKAGSKSEDDERAGQSIALRNLRPPGVANSGREAGAIVTVSKGPELLYQGWSSPAGHLP